MNNINLHLNALHTNIMPTISKLAIIVILLASCEHKEFGGFVNPLDSRNPNFIPPQATLYETQEVIEYTSYTFTWYNSMENMGYSNYTLYSYMLKGYDTAYCDWVNTTAAEYNYLDEGKYTFFIKAQAANAEQEIPDSAILTVNALYQNSIYLKPMHCTIASNTETFTELYVDDVTDLKGIAAQLIFPKNTEITRIEKNETILSQGASDMIFLTNSIEEINSSRRIIVDLVLLGTADSGFTGTAPICKIYYKTTDNTTFNFDTEQTKLKDINNNLIYSTCRGSETWVTK